VSQQISLKEAERKAFRSTYDDGLWDIFLGSFFLMFVIAIYLSVYLGDFWSLVVLYPFWGLEFLFIRLVRKQVVAPRIGVAKIGQSRQVKMKKFTTLMLVVNVIAFLLGLYAAANFGAVSGWTISIIFGLMLLMGFSLTGYFLDFYRLYVYGLLASFSPLVGEWLYVNAGASHHGYPIVFGFIAGLMILVGLVIFLRLLRNNPLPLEGMPQEKA